MMSLLWLFNAVFQILQYSDENLKLKIQYWFSKVNDYSDRNLHPKILPLDSTD